MHSSGLRAVDGSQVLNTSWRAKQVLDFVRRALAYGNMRAENREHQFPQRPGSHLSEVSHHRCSHSIGSQE